MAQSIEGYQLLATCTGTVQTKPAFQFKVAWAGQAFGNEAAWTDESAYVLPGISWEMQVSNLDKGPVGGGMFAGKLTLTLDNGTGRFSCNNSAGALYAYIGNGGYKGLRAYLAAGRWYEAAEVLPQFSGYITGWVEDHTNRTVNVTCQDRSWKLRQLEACTALLTNTTVGAFLNAVVALLPAADQPTVVADETLYPVPFIWLDDDHPVKDLGMLAEAQGGCIYFDYAGQLVSENATHLLRSPHATSQFTFDAGDYPNLRLQSEVQEKVSRVVVSYTPRYIAVVQEVWRLNQNSDENVQLGAGEVRTITARFRQPVAAFVQPVRYTDFRAVYAGGGDASALVTIATMTNAKATKIDIPITNTASHAVYITLRLRGTPVLPREPVIVEVGDADATAYKLQDNPYVNSSGHAKARRDALQMALTNAKPLYTMPDCPCLPWLTLGDRVTAGGALGITAQDFYIMGLRGRIDTDYMNSFALVPAPIYDIAAPFIIGTSKLGAGAGSGTVFP